MKTNLVSPRLFRPCLLLLFLVSDVPTQAQVWITNSMTISETNTNYDGQNLIVSGAGITLTLDGSHALNSLLLTNGATLTHSPCTASTTHKLDVNVSGVISVSSNSSIDVSGKGYVVGHTKGNTTTGAADGNSGGSYGGLGGNAYYGVANAVYGDYRDAAEWGSGGASSGTGGGRVRLVAGTLQLDGQVLANGSTAGVGSGGGVYVAAATLAGGGSIQAKGGSSTSSYGGGGGGRVAVYAGDYSAFNLASITAPGGSGGTQGGAGSVYMKRNADLIGTLVFDTGGNGNGWAVMGLPGTNYFAVPDAVVVRGSRTMVQSEHAGMTLALQQSLTVEQSGYLMVNGVLSLQGSGALTVTGGGRLDVNGSVLLGVPLGLTNGGLWQVNGSVASTVPVPVSASTLAADYLAAPSVSVVSTGLVTCLASTASQMHKLELNVAGTILVSSDSTIDVSGKGYLPGYTKGNMTAGAADGKSGGSYGGLGANAYFGVANAVYGDYRDAAEWGSGGAGGGTGGGRVRLVAGTLQLEGQVLATGSTAGSGGGSGGGIYVAAATLTGGGSIQAKGGSSTSGYGGGGGGRIAVYAGDYSAFNLASITAPGGSGGTQGGAGSVYMKRNADSNGTLVFDAGSNGNGNNGWAVLGLPGTNYFAVPDAVVVRGSRTMVQTEHAGMTLDLQQSLTVQQSGYLMVNGVLNLQGSGALTVTGGGRLDVNGSVLLGVPLVLTNGGLWQVNGLVTSTVPVTVSGSTLAADYLGAPTMSVVSTGLVTCLASTASQMHKLDVNVSGVISVSSNSSIDVSGKGYLPGYTTGNTTTGQATGRSGGSYGGLGCDAYFGVANAVYGDYRDAAEWGSGGSAAGGGRVRLVAGTLQLDGQVLANGSNSGNGAGSGGGVYVAVATLAGGGSIQAKGGSSTSGYGGGGGGRIAVYAGDYSAFNLAGITAPGGSGGSQGGAGTVYVKRNAEAFGTLTFDAGNNGNGRAVLGLPGTNYFAVPDAVVVRGSRTMVQTEHAGMTLDLQQSLTVQQNGYLAVNGVLNLQGSGALTVTGGGRLDVNGSVLLGVPLALTNGGLWQVNGLVTSTVPVTVSGSTLAADYLGAPTMSVVSTGLVTCLASTASQMHKLELNVAETIQVDVSSKVDVSGLGYVVGYTKGNTTVGGATGNSGGSYGGLGGNAYYGVANAVYGDYRDAAEWGSGGASSGTGGGRVRLVAGTLQLDGQVLANSSNPGVGSGGGIYVAVATLAGGGSIQAKGGSSTSSYGGGGGGRVAVYAGDYSAFNLASITAPGGSGGTQGGAGSVYVIQGRAPTRAYLVSPIARNSDAVISLNPLILAFSRPIQTNALNAANITLSGPLGSVSARSILALGGANFAIDFPPFTANGIYHFTILPTLLDAEGFQLDQNANGIPGEADDAYDFTLILDTIPPRVTHHAPEGDVAGTVTSMDVWFSEAMDVTKMTTATFRLVQPSSNSITPTSITEVGLNRFRFTFPAQTVTGRYQLYVSTNATDLAGNALSILPQPLAFNLVPVDLQLSNVSVSTNHLSAGDAVTLFWTGRNATGAPLLGDWTDGVYLSTDNRWDPSDVPSGTIAHTGGLTTNEIYAAQTTSFVPGLLPGNYYFVVRSDIFNQERETGETNNQVALGPLPLSLPALTANGGPFAGTFTSGQPSAWFVITLGAGQSLRLTLNGGATAGNGLFVSRGTIPTSQQADFRNTTTGTTQQILITAPPGGGTFYVLTHSDQPGNGSSFQLAAETGAMFLSAITPHRHGNTANATVTITGTGFDETTTVNFVSTNGTVRLPDSIHLLSSETLRLDLGLPSWPGGFYTVRVIKGATTNDLAQKFEVVQGGITKLETRLIVPDSIGFNIPIRQTLWIEYTNTGEIPMPAPLLKLTGDHNVSLTLDSALAIPSRGFGGAPPGVTDTVQVMATGSGATPGILQPGDSGRIPVYYIGLSQEAHYPEITFTLSSLKADAVTWIECPPIRVNIGGAAAGGAGGGSGGGGGYSSPPCTIHNWHIGWFGSGATHEGTLQNDVRPPSIPADAWDAIWRNMSTNIGPEWGDYVIAVANDVNFLHSIGQDVTDATKLWSYEVAKASASLSPVQFLAGAVDAATPTPGLPLTFRRVFGQSIVSRYELGPFGRGWTHNWDIQAVAQTNGDVVVRGPGGVDRLFSRNRDGVFIASPGDYGQLTLANGASRLTETDKTFWQFRSDSLLDYVQDNNTNRITLGYASGRLTTITHSNGKQLLLQYNGAGHIFSMTDPVGPGAADDRLTTFAYDGSGEHLVTVTAPGNRVTSYSYDTSAATGRKHALLSITFPDNTHNYFAYQGDGRLIQTSRDGGAQTVSYVYDSAGGVTVTNATGQQTFFGFGIGGQLAQVRDGAGRVVHFGYDSKFQFTQLLGPGGEKYRYSSDARGNLTGIGDPMQQTTAFSYEPAFNRLASVTDARRNGLGYAYDTRGNLTTITYADSTRESFGYDNAGNLITSTNRRGQVINYTYNSAGQLKTKDYAATAGVDFTYAYDAAGNLTNSVDASGVTAMAYDANTDRLTRIGYPGGKFFTFAYDNAGRRTQRTDQDGNLVAYLYDSIGRLERMTNGTGGLIVHYEYDMAGRLAKKTLGNGVFTTYEYNAAGQMRHLINHKADTTVLSHFDYAYDGSGRRISMTANEGTYAYGYDALGQLTSVTFPGGRVVNYAYDAAGNRTQVTDNGVPTAYAANALNQYTSAGGATYGFDADGNLTNKTEGVVSTIYTYDTENRLIGVTTPTDTWTYTYDAFGNRTTATHNGVTTRYVMDPTGLGNVAAEYDGSGNLIARYDHGFGLLNRADAGGNPAYYTFSAIGHTSELTDPAGAVLNSYAYDPFGVSLVKTETMPNPFEFVGEFGVMNEGSGLEFMRARFYDGKAGRFVGEDPYQLGGGDANFYNYVANSPISAIDPNGAFIIGVNYSGVAFRGGWNPSTGEVYGGLGLALGFPSPASVFTWGGRNGRWGFNAGIPNVAGVNFSNDSPPFGSFPGLAYVNSWGAYGPIGIRASHYFGQPDSSLRYGYGLGANLEVGSVWRLPFKIYPPTGDKLEQDSQTRNSFDPNDKLSPTGYGTAAFVRADSALSYQIRFENKSDATAPARQVVVTDTLSANVDLNTFELTEISFADQILAIPAGLNHYESAVPMVVVGSNILATVEAALNFSTRTLTLTLSALDPSTGWFSEDPLVGLLYPNDDTGRGVGSISYRVQPRAGVPSGTVIQNRARIVFDYNDPIDTPMVFNTLDSAAPTSMVQPLPALSGRTFLLQWSGHDEANGSGLADFTIYYSTNGLDFAPALQNTTESQGYFFGQPGVAYSFFSLARDNVGHEEPRHALPDAFTFVPTNAPVLSSVTNYVIRPGDNLSFTNQVVQGTPVGTWHFSLGSGAPAGASVNPTNGVLHWIPTCGQASTTNIITVLVTDSGRTNISDMVSFSVAVGDCVQPGLGQQILLAGSSGRVPIYLISTVPLTNLQMTLVSPPTRLMSFNIQPIVSEVCTSSVTPISNGLYRLNLFTCPGQSLVGTQQVAWLNFTAITNQSSGFAPLNFTDLIGFQVDGTPVANFAPQSGRVVVVGEEPLLEMVKGTNRLPLLVLYGKPLPGYSIEWRTNLLSGSWKSVLTNLTVPTNLFLNFTPVPGSGPVNFYRALRVGNLPPAIILALTSTDGTNGTLWFKGSANQTYRIQTTPSLSPPTWTNIATNTAGTDGLFQFTDTNGWRRAQRFYRLVWP